VKDLGAKSLKVPSGEITNAPLLLAHAQTGSNLIVSTGMSTLDEIEEALGVIAFGYMQGANPTITPSVSVFRDAFNSPEGQRYLVKKVTLLHCTTEYPAPLEDINLNAIRTLQDRFGLLTGYSDHSEGICVPIAAAALGVSLIEKHFTLDRALPGPDHSASLDPIQLKAMVESIRNVEKIMGDGEKAVRPCEIANRKVCRKSIVAAQSISVGEAFSEQNLTIKRPGIGISPMEYWSLIGKKSQQNYQADDEI